MHQSHYKGLITMTILSFITMYFLMFAMVDTPSNIFIGINQFYMAGLMTAPMILIEIITMRSMYTNKNKNTVITLASTLTLIIFFLLIRNQTAITDKEFLKSMIPHHAGALLMCQEADLKDPEIKQLCEQIIQNQQAEIEVMKQKLQTIK
jgi:hypothetical protein